MREKDFKYIYGPVSSWRLGASLGIDLFPSSKKICNFDCIYCQVGRTLSFTIKPKIYTKASVIITELKRLPKIKIDYVTFSGYGEPSLEKNLAKIIKAVKRLKIAPVAVLTNASLINQADVRRSLSAADFVSVKLDAYSQKSLEKINRPAKAIRFKKIIQGIKQFKKKFKGRLALQIMLTEENQKHADELAKLASEINPDEIQINTPTRPCAVRPLSRKDIDRIKGYFFGLNFISVYDVQRKKVVAFSRKETLRRRGKIV